MQISDTEVKKILDRKAVVEAIVEIGEARDRADDQALIATVTSEVMSTGDREDRITELRNRIEAGTYNPTGEEIAESMIRRTIADRIR